jgi:hypothetical protein
MKHSIALLAAAAGVSQVSATWGHGGGSWDGNWGNDECKPGYSGGGWHGANPFPCPGNTNNWCWPKQKEGWKWDDLVPGDFSHYDGFDFSGFSCKSKPFKRYDLAGRTFGGNYISGECGHDKAFAPNFGPAPGAETDKFSIKTFHIRPEFDCRLEFHYDMPDGSTCKHSADCSKDGTTVENSQCGGAHKVHFVYPEQGNGKDKCHIEIPDIDFDCDENAPPECPTSSVPATTTTEEVKPTSSVEIPTTKPEETPSTTSEEELPTTVPEESHSTTSEEELPTTVPEETPSTTSEEQQPTTTPEETTTKPEESPSSTTTYIETTPIETTTKPEESSSSTTTYIETTPIETTPIETTTKPEESPSSTTTPIETTPIESTTYVETIETTMVTTYESVSTIFTTETKTVTDCGPEVPDCPGKTTVITVPVSTTVCPITETYVKPTTTVMTSELPPKPTEDAPAPPPEEEMPCPAVVPKCLNTWIGMTECKDNGDAGCFCPNSDFTDKVFQCLYAHGATDDEAAEAISCFQGICAPWMNENPGIVTQVETITTCLTVTGTPTLTATYTTVIVEATVTTDSTTKIITTEVAVPEVTVPPTAAEAAPTTAAPATSAPGPIGTGAPPPGPSTTLPFPGSDAPSVRSSMALGLAVAVMAAMAAF